MLYAFAAVRLDPSTALGMMGYKHILSIYKNQGLRYAQTLINYYLLFIYLISLF